MKSPLSQVQSQTLYDTLGWSVWPSQQSSSKLLGHFALCCLHALDPTPPVNVESSIVPHSLLLVPNIEWWGRGRYGMLEDSVDFMSKKARFPHVTIKRYHFCVSVPTIFDEHC